MAQFPLITAHTGCMGTPDNSLASAQTALSLGADIIEDDIRVTRDGVLVLSHDDHVPCTDGQTGSLSSLTLQQLNDRAAEPVVLLETVLQLLLSHPGKRMNLDLKTDACIAPVADLVHKLNAAEHVFLTGCPYSRALQAAQQAPSLKKLLNINTDRFLSGDYLSGVKQACEEAAHAGCFGLNVPYQLIRPELLEHAADLELPVYIWTVGTAREMSEYAKMGVHSITTRDVATLMMVKQRWEEEL